MEILLAQAPMAVWGPTAWRLVFLFGLLAALAVLIRWWWHHRGR